MTEPVTKHASAAEPDALTEAFLRQGHRPIDRIVQSTLDDHPVEDRRSRPRCRVSADSAGVEFCVQTIVCRTGSKASSSPSTSLSAITPTTPIGSEKANASCTAAAAARTVRLC